MSEISFEVLRERSPGEIINLFGEVLVIPSRLFQRGWELELEAQGHRVYEGDYNGEAAFLVRADETKPRLNVESQRSRKPSSKVDRWRRWKGRSG